MKKAKMTNGQQMMALALAERGKSSAAIARELGIGYNTVYRFVRSNRKTGQQPEEPKQILRPQEKIKFIAEWERACYRLYHSGYDLAQVELICQED